MEMMFEMKFYETLNAPKPLLYLTRCKGFTLIEVMIVLVILAVLATLAAPSFRELILAQRVKTATAELQTSLFLARSEAIKRGSTVSVVPASGDWRNGWIVCVDANSDSSCAATELVIEQKPALSSIGLAAMGGSAISYRRDGRLSGGAATIKAYAESGSAIISRCVIIDLSGRPSVALEGACG
jgi:type IV fimbrial biogenesis protein FimT